MESIKFKSKPVIDALNEFICVAAQEGLNNANNNQEQKGRFEDKFQEAFVQTFHNQAAFPDSLGTLEIEAFDKEVDLEARTGADVRITWKYPANKNKNKNRAQVFVLYLQIKLLYDSVIHYINTIKFSKPEAGWSRTELSDNFKDLDKEIPKLGFFDAQYKSTRVGYENKYQLLQMQNQMAVDAFDEDTVTQVTASYLVFESPKNAATGKLAKRVFLVPVQSFAREISSTLETGASPHYQLQDKDVENLTASQLGKILRYGTVELIPGPNDGFTQWIGNFIKDDFFMQSDSP